MIATGGIGKNSKIYTLSQGGGALKVMQGAQDDNTLMWPSCPIVYYFVSCCIAILVAINQ